MSQSRKYINPKKKNQLEFKKNIVSPGEKSIRFHPFETLASLLDRGTNPPSLFSRPSCHARLGSAVILEILAPSRSQMSTRVTPADTTWSRDKLSLLNPAQVA